MAANRNTGGESRKYTADEAKRKIVLAIQEGLSVAAACQLVGKSPKTYEYYRDSDKDFASQVDHVRAVRARQGAARPTGTFAEFCPKYLGQDVYLHQLQWIDLLEGREPRDVHPAITYEPNRPELLIINTPPEHAKSTTITANYVTYRICQDPNVRILVVSKSLVMARKFIYQVKNRLTHPRYADLQVDFAPADGFKASADAWTADMIYLGGEVRDSGEKDPTLQALGMGGHIYGSRADLIILDDCIVLSNAHEYEKQIEWITAEVLTRLNDNGKLLVVGTRMAPQDMYSELRDPSRWPDGSPWTYFAQPAVLEFAEDPKDWVTLWPRSNVPRPGYTDPPGDDGLYPAWDGPALHRRRAVVQPRTWAMVYMQQQVLEDAVFPADAVKASINNMRKVGPMPRGSEAGHHFRKEGMDGLYVIGGLDPAAAGNTAIVVLGVDRATRKRYVLDVINQAGMTPTAMRNAIKTETERFGIHEWRIEKNAFQTMLTQDAEIREFLASRGCLLKEHHTGNNKWDVDFGVASMSMLFDGYQDGRQLIELPSTQSEGVKALVEQLITWAPETKNKTDVVMALWFAEIRAREIVDNMAGRYFNDNPYLTPWQEERRVVVNLDDYFMAQQAGHMGYL